MDRNNFKKQFFLALSTFIREGKYFFYSIILPLLLFPFFTLLFSNDDLSISATFVLPGFFVLVTSTCFVLNVPIYIMDFLGKKDLQNSAIDLNVLTIPVITSLFANVILVIIELFLLIIIGRYFFDASFPENLLLVILSTILGSILLMCLAIFIIINIKKKKYTYFISFTLYYLLIILSGATIPIEIFPGIVKIISLLIPTTYVVDLLKEAWYSSGMHNISTNIIVVIIFIVCIILNIVYKIKKNRGIYETK